MRTGPISLVLLFVSTWSAFAQEFVEPTAPKGGDPSLINAVPAQPKVWPATLIFSSDVGSCTSTVVGERALITAAHCVADGASGSITIKQKKISFTCSNHPGYAAGNRTLDYSLCLLSDKITGIEYENVSTSLAYPRKTAEAILLGFGCTSKGGFDKNFGVLHVGKATVVRTPEGESADLVLKGDAAVCFGDSGGAAYFYLRSDSEKSRVVVGINSRGDISKLSFISATATQAFVSWALEWSTKTGALICGLDIRAKGCRPV